MQVTWLNPLPHRPRSSFFLGCDLGQARDFTACVALERIDTPADPHEKRPTKWNKRIKVCGITRLERETPYPLQVQQVGEFFRRLPTGHRRTELIVDRSGCGRAVYDLFKQGGLKPVGVTITGGESETRDDDGGWRVSKTELVSVITALLHRQDLDIPNDHPLAPTLVQELRDFKVGFTAAGTATFAARQGAFDDLVLACAIGCWRALRFDKDRVTSREFSI